MLSYQPRNPFLWLWKWKKKGYQNFFSQKLVDGRANQETKQRCNEPKSVENKTRTLDCDFKNSANSTNIQDGF